MENGKVKAEGSVARPTRRSWCVGMLVILALNTHFHREKEPKKKVQITDDIVLWLENLDYKRKGFLGVFVFCDPETGLRPYVGENCLVCTYRVSIDIFLPRFAKSFCYLYCRMRFPR